MCTPVTAVSPDLYNWLPAVKLLEFVCVCMRETERLLGGLMCVCLCVCGWGYWSKEGTSGPWYCDICSFVILVEWCSNYCHWGLALVFGAQPESKERCQWENSGRVWKKCSVSGGTTLLCPLINNTPTVLTVWLIAKITVFWGWGGQFKWNAISAL